MNEEPIRILYLGPRLKRSLICHKLDINSLVDELKEN